MISAIVLVAGQATRFGECKQLVRLDGKTLLEHAHSLASLSDLAEHLTSLSERGGGGGSGDRTKAMVGKVAVECEDGSNLAASHDFKAGAVDEAQISTSRGKHR